MRKTVSLGVVMAFGLGTATIASATDYTVQDLGPCANFLGAVAINQNGDVAGSAFFGSQNNAALWNAGSSIPIDIGNTGVPSNAVAINNGRQIVGNFGNGNSPNAFIWDSVHGMQVLPPLPGNSAADVGGINLAGEASGESLNYSGDLNTRAVLWKNGTAVNLGTLPGGTYSTASGRGTINDYGQVVGTSLSVLSPPVGQAFIWTPFSQQGTTGSMVGLGTLGGAASDALCVNANGWVTGDSLLSDGDLNAFLWRPNSPNGSSGTMVDLGSLDGTNSYGAGVNDAGEVVGYASVDGVFHAFVSDGSGMLDLNSLVAGGAGWVLNRAYGINDSGQIVGFGTLGGQLHSFELNPVPEPTTVSALAIGGLSLLRKRRLRKRR